MYAVKNKNDVLLIMHIKFYIFNNLIEHLSKSHLELIFMNFVANVKASSHLFILWEYFKLIIANMTKRGNVLRVGIKFRGIFDGSLSFSYCYIFPEQI